MTEQFIERKILIGLITSTEFIKEIKDFYEPAFILSTIGKKIAAWSMEHYDKMGEAPGDKIQSIFLKKAKAGLPPDLLEELEEDFLPELSKEHIASEQDLEFLITQAREYFIQNQIEQLQVQGADLLSKGKVMEAEALLRNFIPLRQNQGDEVDFSKPEILERVTIAFSLLSEPLISFPFQLGQFWNEELCRGSFVALLGPEKSGKSFWLMEFAQRACKANLNVAFFQAGDMTESQQIIRLGINLARKSNKEKYTGEMFEPVRDCIHNQLDTCDKEERECDFGPFSDKTKKELRNQITLKELKEAWKDNKDYRPCYNCSKYKSKQWGTPWLQKVVIKNPLEVNEAKRLFESFYIKGERRLMLSSHANGTLSVQEMESILERWQKELEFVPDVIIVDYADLLVESKFSELRHNQDQIWKGLRRMSQTNKGQGMPLLITVTQADADSYGQNLLKLKNFSEDKRKYAHATAFYGVNHDPEGREKEIGIMRFNKLILREDDFHVSDICYVLQNLRRGLPYVSSYF